MVRFKALIEQFDQKGEKTGWSYVSIPSDLAQKINPGSKKSFRVKGKLDAVPIKQLALIPMGNGDYILPLKASIRKTIHKNKGAMLALQLEFDNEATQVSSELIECLKDSPTAQKNFEALLHSHQMYYSNWITSGKTPQTRAKRIMATILGMERKLSFAEVLKLNAQTVNK